MIGVDAALVLIAGALLLGFCVGVYVGRVLAREQPLIDAETPPRPSGTHLRAVPTRRRNRA